MNTPVSSDVAIVGGGPVGMALACELLRHGLTVRIFDKAAATKQYSRAPIFWPRAQDALDLMGIHHLWDGVTSPMRRMNVKVYGKPAGRVELGFGESAHPVAMLVGQDVSEAILDRHLTSLGNAVERSREIVDLDVRDDGGTLQVRAPNGEIECVEARWIVGCDGTQSIVRSRAAIGWEGRALKGLKVPVADATPTWTLPAGDGDAYVTLTPRGYFLAIPLPERWRVIVAVPDDTPRGEEPVTDLEGVAALAAEALEGPVTLSDAPWVSVVRYGNYIAPTFRSGRALLAGDAAHSIAPLSGQGMNTGVQDAFNLGWKLAYVHKGWSDDALLDSYTDDRRPVAARLVRTTNRFFDRVLQPGPLQQRIVRVVAPLALRIGRVRRAIAGFYTETDVSYCDSPLNDSARGLVPAPGDHACGQEREPGQGVHREEDHRELLRGETPAHIEPVRDEGLDDQRAGERVEPEERGELRHGAGRAVDPDEPAIAVDPGDLDPIGQPEEDHEIRRTDRGIQEEEGPIRIGA